MPIVIKAPFMMFEIATYGLVCGLVWKLTKNIKWMNTTVRAIVSVIVAQIAGRIVNAACTVIAVNFLGVTHPAVQVGALWTSVVMGLPGIIIQIVAVPAIVTVLAVILKKKA